MTNQLAEATVEYSEEEGKPYIDGHCPHCEVGSFSVVVDYQDAVFCMGMVLLCETCLTLFSVDLSPFYGPTKEEVISIKKELEKLKN